MTDNVVIFERELEDLIKEDYKALVIALGKIEGITITDEQYEDWYNSDYSLINDSLQD